MYEGCICLYHLYNEVTPFTSTDTHILYPVFNLDEHQREGYDSDKLLIVPYDMNIMGRKRKSPNTLYWYALRQILSSEYFCC